MKCLSIKQPYASQISAGEKTLEIRSWRTNFRGTFIICSSKKPAYKEAKGPLGVTICTANLIDVVRFEPWHAKQAMVEYVPDMFALVLADINPMKFNKIKGRLGFFNYQHI